MKKAIIATREGNFTASNINKILGTPKKKGEQLTETAKSYVLEVVSEIITGARSEEVFSHALDWGKANEAFAVQAFEAATGKKGIYYGGSEPTFFKFEDMPLGCSPDYVLDDAIVEFKCPFNTARHVEAIKQNAEWLAVERKEYYAQMQLQMMILDKPQGIFVSFDPRIKIAELQLAMIPVAADADFQAKILEKAAICADFMQKVLSELLPF